MPLGQASGFSRADPGGRVTPRFRHRLIRFRHFIDGSLALASLNLACRDQVPTFPQRSPPSLLTTAARGGLRPAPDCRPRRALLHLSYSSAPSYPVSAFVTHNPFRTFHEGRRRAVVRIIDRWAGYRLPRYSRVLHKCEIVGSWSTALGLPAPRFNLWHQKND